MRNRYGAPCMCGPLLVGGFCFCPTSMHYRCSVYKAKGIHTYMMVVCEETTKWKSDSVLTNFLEKKLERHIKSSVVFINMEGDDIV